MSLKSGPDTQGDTIGALVKPRPYRTIIKERLLFTLHAGWKPVLRFKTGLVGNWKFTSLNFLFALWVVLT